MGDTKALLLSAGLGTRLKPLTDIWPKCLMPIRGRPLLGYWLDILQESGINDVLVNTHHLSEYVEDFLDQPCFIDWVNLHYESKLLGTAGTVRENISFLKDSTVLLVHADNWTCCNFSEFLYYHYNQRPKGTVMTMMTFTCSDPSTCGIVELDCNGIVIKLHEKVKNPPGKLANAAIYIIEPEVINWIESNPEITDFSTEVIPQFLGKIATWANKSVHRDIGTISELVKAQKDCENSPLINVKNNSWQDNFYNSKVFKDIDNYLNK
jgi:mannose-1-phosphate guanylyltransferase